MKLFWLLLIALPFRSVSQDFTITAGSNVPTRTMLVSPNPETFCDTVLVGALILTDTATGATKDKNVFQERKGNISLTWDGYNWRQQKDAYTFRYWFFYDGFQVFIDPQRILKTYTAK